MSGSPMPGRCPARVSAIMAACNVERTIEQAVRSVLEQTHPVHELIIVDDGSTDATAAVVGRIDESRVRLFSQANRGPSAARNAGIALASGDYIACIDGDDRWHPDKLAQQLARLHAEPAARVCYGWTDRVDAHGRRMHTDRRAAPQGDVHRALLAGNFITSGSNTLIERDALIRAGGFDETLRSVEDWELHVRLAARHPFVSTGSVVVDYRLTSGSLSSDLAGMEAAFLAARDKVFGALIIAEPRLHRQCTASFHRYLAKRCLQDGLSTSALRASVHHGLIALRTEPLNVRLNLQMLMASFRAVRQQARASSGAPSSS